MPLLRLDRESLIPNVLRVSFIVVLSLSDCRGLFRTQSNISDENDFAKIVNG